VLAGVGGKFNKAIVMAALMTSNIFSYPPDYQGNMAIRKFANWLCGATV